MRARLAAAVALVALASSAPAGATSDEHPVGRTMDERCALARERVRVPFPDRWLRCTAEPAKGTEVDGWFWRHAPAGAVGQCVCDPGKVWWIVVHAGTDADPVPTGEVAARIAHEVGHAYSALAWTERDEAWVRLHEPFAEHWMRCVTTRTAPC